MKTSEQLVELSLREILGYIVEDSRIEFDEAMRRFYASETFDKLLDEETGLFIESPAYVYGIFLDELKLGSLKNVNL